MMSECNEPIYQRKSGIFIHSSFELAGLMLTYMYIIDGSFSAIQTNLLTVTECNRRQDFRWIQRQMKRRRKRRSLREEENIKYNFLMSFVI